MLSRKYTYLGAIRTGMKPYFKVKSTYRIYLHSCLWTKKDDILTCLVSILKTTAQVVWVMTGCSFFFVIWDVYTIYMQFEIIRPNRYQLRN